MIRVQPSLLPLLLCTIATLTGCAGKREARKPRVPVTIAVAEQRAMPFALRATGTVEAIRTADVGSQVGGVLQRVTFREGDEVREGQPLFQLDARPFRAALDQARSALQRDRAQALIAHSNGERARAMFDQQFISQAEWDQARATAETWAATVLADSAAVQTARLNLEFATIRAPIGGRTGRLLVHQGDLVRAATSEPLVTINQTRPVRVAFTVPEDAVAVVQRHRNQNPRVTARFSAADTVAIAGTLAFVDNALDPNSGTLLLKGEFPNTDQRLMPGQFVDVELVLFDQNDAIVVPETAVTRGQQGSFVYVMAKDSTVATRPITVSRNVGLLTIVDSGLEAGEIVVTDGQLRLSPGARVMVRSESGSKP
ncbi:MAG: efflux RND transporter periplasmic adaptor subunit [Candidatus Eisenbacteria bacterium]|uniref:Efflux RND transporter periplasmic adaptor subunit n=1 Tax=Eiseniibacteriota bacterium TaxID=2212470 RepID=A0A849SR72_UNCEI|nr:efflux RND transporter periplasmic adaptor subunit [Candidatus Eisenbacteria bacterium]